MARRVYDSGLEVANGELFVIVKKVVKVRTIRRGVVACLENGNPGGDDAQNVLADGYLATQLSLEIPAAVTWSAWMWVSRIHSTCNCF